MRHVRSYVQQTELLTSVPHFVRYCFYMNFHLRGTATLTSVAWSSAVELPLHVLTIYVFRSRDSNSQPSACEANVVTNYFTTATPFITFTLVVSEIHMKNVPILKIKH